jgi:hypothetical protein
MAARRGRTEACPAGDIVLTMVPNRAAYGPHQFPVFRIDIVSTGAAVCAFHTGRESLRILITGGSRATWDSGACLHGVAAHVEYLRRGVPSVASIVWDRRLLAGGCMAAQIAARPGRYVAMAASGSVTSPAKAFELW